MPVEIGNKSLEIQLKIVAGMRKLGLKLGLSGEATQIVTEQETAAKLGSGLVDAYSTPSLVSLMENASVAAIEGFMSDGQTTVGVEVSVRHLAPTPVGMHVKALAVLEGIRGNRLKFKVEAWDEKERIGEGLHTRVIIDIPRFSRRLQEKASAVHNRPNGGAKGYSNVHKRL